MAKEITIAKESSVTGLRSRNAMRRTNRSSANKTAKVPKGDRGFYDDSVAIVYDDKGKVVEKGLWDYSAYRDEPTKWNDGDGNYDLPHGYKIVLNNS